MQRILLINFGGIGDEILFLPSAAALKKTYPDSSITLCLEKRSRAFLALTDLIDDYFFVNIKTGCKYFELLKLYFKALTGRFDIVISSGSNPLIPVLLFFTGIKKRIGYASNSISKKLLTHPAVLNKNQYAALMYFDLVKTISDAEFEPPYIKIDNIEKEKNSIVVHPGASRISAEKNIVKTLAADIWAEIIIKLLEAGRKVYLAGGSDDAECIEKIRQHMKNYKNDNFVDMYGKTKDIRDLACLIKKAEILVCADSAPMHTGAALGTKTAAIFGPTDEKKLIMENSVCRALVNNAECRPCLWDKRLTVCPELSCLKFDADTVVKEILNM